MLGLNNGQTRKPGHKKPEFQAVVEKALKVGHVDGSDWRVSFTS